MIVKKTEIYYYCTKCDKEYAQEDKEDGLVCIECCLEKVEEGCKDCMYQCFEPKSEKIRSHLRGCGRWFCKNCIESTKFFDAWYPSQLCKECVSKYGLKKFYGPDHGEALWNDIEVWRRGNLMKTIPGTDGQKFKSIKKSEMDQKIFQRFYISPKYKKNKEGWI